MRSTRILTVVWLMFTAAILTCNGCTGRGASVETAAVPSAAPAPALQAQLPELPQDAWSEDAKRQASETFSLTIQGTEAVSYNGSLIMPSEMALYPQDAEIRYAIYRFGGVLPDASISSLEVYMADCQPDSTVYFALADYTANRWKVIGRSSPLTQPVFELADEFDASRNVNAGYACYLAVIAAGAGNFAEIDLLSIDADSDLAPPAWLTASDALYDNLVKLNWDAVPSAEVYDVYVKLASAGEEEWQLLKTVDGINTTSHEVTDNPSCLYNVPYEYRVRARNASDISVDSITDSGFRATPAPGELYASDGIYPDRVDVHFSRVSGSGTLVDIYRDDALLEADFDPATPPFGSNFMLYSDTSVGSLQPHEYFVVVKGPSGQSQPSPRDVGYRGELAAGPLASGAIFTSFYGDAVFFGTPPEQHIGYAYFNEAQKQLEFLHADPFVISDPEPEVVAAASLDNHMSATVHGGRTWIAYGNDDEALGARGLWLATSGSVIPTGSGDWDSVLLDPVRLSSDGVVLEELAGGLALMYQTFSSDDLSTDWKFIWLPGPLTELPTDWQTGLIAHYPVGTDHPATFDFADFGGRPWAAYTEGVDGVTSINFLGADSSQPLLPQDWSTHQIVEFSVNYGDGSGVDVVNHNGRMELAAAFGASEGDGGLLVFSSQVPHPSKPEHWNGEQLAEFNDVDSRGVRLHYTGDVAFVAFADDDSGLPRMFTPLGPDKGLGSFHREWLEFQPGNAGDAEDWTRCRGIPHMIDFEGYTVVLGNALNSPDESERSLLQCVIQPVLPSSE